MATSALVKKLSRVSEAPNRLCCLVSHAFTPRHCQNRCRPTIKQVRFRVRPDSCPPTHRIPAEMSLADASEARKARLIALRKRKAGEAMEERCVDVSWCPPG